MIYRHPLYQNVYPRSESQVISNSSLAADDRALSGGIKKVKRNEVVATYTSIDTICSEDGLPLEGEAASVWEAVDCTGFLGVNGLCGKVVLEHQSVSKN